MMHVICCYIEVCGAVSGAVVQMLNRMSCGNKVGLACECINFVSPGKKCCAGHGLPSKTF